MNNTLTALTGIKVGHATHEDKLTGCTFVLFDRDLPVAYTSLGGGAATYNTEMLRNGKSFFRRHGLFIAGGSMQGLTSAAEINQELISRKIGYRDSNVINPSISGAIIYDLGLYKEQYDPSYGKEAFENLSNKPVQNGNVGAGTGATVGKFAFTQNRISAMKSGVGCARKDLANGIVITALSVVNAVGNIINRNGTILAGNRDGQNGFKIFDDMTDILATYPSNTTISIVGINVDLKTRENYEKVSLMASQGHTRAISPVNLSIDGDTVFVFSTEEIKLKQEKNYMLHDLAIDVIGHTASLVVQESIYDACKVAKTIEFEDALSGIIPSVLDYPKK